MLTRNLEADNSFSFVLNLVFQSPGTSEWAQIFTIVVLLFISALIAAAETAYFSLSPADLKTLTETPLPVHDRILKIARQPQRLLATVLISYNAINISIILLSTSVLSEIMLFNPGQEGIKFLVEVVAVTFMLLIFCEVIPKVYARQNSLRVALIMSRPMHIIEKMFYPFTWIMLRTGSRLYSHRPSLAGKQLTANELEHALEITFGSQPANQEKKILEGIVKFGSTNVKQIMCPRTDMTAINKDLSFFDLLAVIREYGYSRLPVYAENHDKIQGVLFVKDVLPFLESNENQNWQKLVREPFFVPENRKIDDLLVDFKTTRNHMAIVVDEYGGTVGLVTLEDVLEEIVGDITDEFDDDQVAYTRIDESNFVFEGKTQLIDLYKVLKIDGDDFERSKGESDTLAGFILEIAGRMPRNGEILTFGKYTFTIEAADNKRIKQVKVSVKNLADSLQQAIKGKMPLLLIALTFIMSCGNSSITIPKPQGLMRIELPAPTYKAYNGECPFATEISEISEIVPSNLRLEGYCYLNIEYRKYKATLYLTYTSPGDSLGKLLQKSHNLAYSHDIKAGKIDPEMIVHDSSRVYGLIYHITGNAASNTQFYVTDSTTNFIRGALYFYTKPNYDSILPVLNFIDNDIRHMLSKLTWKNKGK
ncbi:MAG: gliding motility lipoprotein GldD [Flavobacteriales bacterium]